MSERMQATNIIQPEVVQLTEVVNKFVSAKERVHSLAEKVEPEGMVSPLEQQGQTMQEMVNLFAQNPNHIDVFNAASK
jgi:hypothetical protein